MVLQCVAMCCSVLQQRVAVPVLGMPAHTCGRQHGFSANILHLGFVLNNSTARTCNVAVCCSVLQCVAVCCNGFSDRILHLVFYEIAPLPVPEVLQRAVVFNSVLQCALVCCCVLLRFAACCSVLQYFRKLAKKIDLLRIYL